MRTSRRAFLWLVILGVAIVLVAILQRRGDDAVVPEAAGIRPRSIDATRTIQPVEPDTASAASIAGPGDEVETQCAQTVREAADFVTMERNAAGPVQPADSDGDRLVAELDAAQRKLEGSRDPEHFLAALLLEPAERRASNDSIAQAKLLDLADRATRSGLKLLAWHALRACVAAKQSCPVVHLEQRLLDADRQNAEAWGLVATLRYERGDGVGALAAMQGAARAPTSTSYWTETIALIERSLAAQTAMPYVERMANAFGSAAANLPSESGLLNMCKAESASSRAWADACLAFGTLRGKHNETMQAQAIAQSIREQALTALGDREGAAEVAAERALFRAEQRAMGRQSQLQWELIQADPAQMHAYLGAVQQFGELAGVRKFLRQEVPPLLERAGLLERDGARECVALFFLGTRRASAGQRAQVADELHISMRSPSRLGQEQDTVQIRPDGMISLPFVRRTRRDVGTVVRPESELAAVGKTEEQLQREIATMLSEYHRSPEVVVILLPHRSDAELQLEFDNARKEAAERRSNSR